MDKLELARKLAEMTRQMERARLERNARVRRTYHETDPQAWEALKKVLDYQEPPHAED